MSEQVVLTEAEQHIKEQAARAFRLGKLYEEEGYGLLWAISSRTPLHWSKDVEKQARFLKGFNDGREILRVAGAAAAATPKDAA